MGRQHVYTIDRLPDKDGDHIFRVAKHDKTGVMKDLPFTMEEGEYKVVRSTKPNPNLPNLPGELSKPGFYCDCFAGLMGKECRHIEMVLIAEDEDGLNNGRYFDFDKHRWTDKQQASPVKRVGGS